MSGEGAEYISSAFLKAIYLVSWFGFFQKLTETKIQAQVVHWTENARRDEGRGEASTGHARLSATGRAVGWHFPWGTPPNSELSHSKDRGHANS